MAHPDKTKSSNRLHIVILLSYLEEVAKDYHGQTIDNIIRQLQARFEEIIKQETT